MSTSSPSQVEKALARDSYAGAPSTRHDITQDSESSGMDLLAQELREISRIMKLQAQRDEYVGVQSAKGYATFTVCATFLAGTQAQVLSLVTDPESLSLPSAFFFLGLLITVFGALLCFEASRWFDTLTEKEAAWREQYIGLKHGKPAGRSVESSRGFSFDRSDDCDSGHGHEHPRQLDNHLERPGFVDVWTVISIHAGPYLIFLGLGCFIVGLLLYIWRTQAFATKIISVIFSILCAALFPPFGMKHNRYNVLKCLALERRSEVGLFPNFLMTLVEEQLGHVNSTPNPPISSPGTVSIDAEGESSTSTTGLLTSRLDSHRLGQSEYPGNDISLSEGRKEFYHIVGP